MAFRDRASLIATKISEMSGAMVGKETEEVCPVEHRFEHGFYTRVLTSPAGVLAVTKIHRTANPFFIMKGEVSILTEDGVQRVKAPYVGITKEGTQRVVFVHEPTKWVTVHKTEATEVDEAEELLFAVPDLGSSDRAVELLLGGME